MATHKGRKRKHAAGNGDTGGDEVLPHNESDAACGFFKRDFSLRPLQVETMERMLKMESERGGGLLAHDMGLGKTVQALALIDVTKGRTARSSRATVPTTLVVTEKTVATQWHKEINKHCRSGDDAGVLRFTSMTRSSDYLPAERLATIDITFVTYDILARVHMADNKGSESYRMLYENTWKRVILDEAHRIKNPRSERYKAVNALKADFRWAMTGTPAQNNLVELFAVLSFLRPEGMPDISAWEDIRTSLYTYGTRSLHNDTVQKLLDRSMIRMTQAEVEGSDAAMQLPDIYYWIYSRPFETEAERRLYSCAHDGLEKIEHFKRIAKDVRDGKRSTRGNAKPDAPPSSADEHPSAPPQEQEHEHRPQDAIMDSVSLSDRALEQLDSASLASLGNNQTIRMRQACCAPCVIDERLEDDCFGVRSTKVNMLVDYLRSRLDDDMCYHKDKISRGASAPDASSSGRQRLSGSGKVVVFFEWTRMMDVVMKRLRSEGIAHMEVRGKTPDRAEVLRRFDAHDGDCVLLLSIKAVCTGVEITSANRVAFFMPIYNPELEHQALKRVWRFGQTLTTHVTWFLVMGTCEEWVYQMAREKVGETRTIDTRNWSMIRHTGQHGPGSSDLVINTKTRSRSLYKLFVEKCRQTATGISDRHKRYDKVCAPISGVRSTVHDGASDARIHRRDDRGTYDQELDALDNDTRAHADRINSERMRAEELERSTRMGTLLFDGPLNLSPDVCVKIDKVSQRCYYVLSKTWCERCKTEDDNLLRSGGISRFIGMHMDAMRSPELHMTSGFKMKCRANDTSPDVARLVVVGSVSDMVIRLRDAFRTLEALGEQVDPKWTCIMDGAVTYCRYVGSCIDMLPDVSKLLRRMCDVYVSRHGATGTPRADGVLPFDGFLVSNDKPDYDCMILFRPDLFFRCVTYTKFSSACDMSDDKFFSLQDLSGLMHDTRRFERVALMSPRPVHPPRQPMAGSSDQ